MRRIRTTEPQADPGAIGREQLEVIHGLNAALTTASSATEIYELALDALDRTIRPDRASVLLFDPDGVMRFKAWRGLSPEYRRATEGHSPWTPDTVDPEPVLAEDVLVEPSLAPLRDVIAGEGIRALAFVPLVSDRRVCGKFMLYAARPHRYTDEEIWLAKVIGAHITFALDRRRAEEQLVFQKTLLELQTEASIEGILVVSNEGRMVSFNRRFVEMWDIPDDVVATRSDAAALDAVRDRLADPQEFLQRVAYLYEHPEEESRDEIRLRDGRTFDRYSGPIRASDGTLHGRAWFFRDVTEDRRKEQEQRFLVAASQVLSSSLDHEATLREVARLAVDDLAERCVVYLARPGGFARVRAARTPGDADRAPPLAEGEVHRGDLPEPVRDVLASRGSVLLPEIGELLRADLGAPGRAGQRLAKRSATIVPLVARNASLGAIVLVAPTGRPPYDERDLRFAEELARRAATAVDNSLLHHAERRARELAQQSANRSARLQAVTAGLSRALTAAEVANLVVTEAGSALAADAGIAYAFDAETGTFTLMAATGYAAEAAGRWRTFRADAPGPAREALEGRSLVVVGSGAELDERWPGLASDVARDREEASMTAPLVVRGQVLGVLHVGFRSPRVLTEEDRNFFSTLARQCSQALDRARLYESEHRAAETLQLSLLPGRLPEVDGVRLGARYLPAGAGAQVGGDWYDAIPVDGRLGLVVGDVEGRGIPAASKMGQLRTALRAYALQETHPGAMLEKLNRFVHGLGSSHFATIACIVLDPATGEIRIANAGHPPPLVVDPDGSAGYLEVPMSPPIGAIPDALYPERSERLEPGATLVLYTDGLVERRRIALTDGLRRLREAAERSTGEPPAMLDRIVEELADGDRGDDVALLAVGRSTRPAALVRHLPTDPHALAGLRADLRSWLGAAGATTEEIQAVLVASGEAVTNALEHPIDPGEPVVEIVGELGEGTVSLVVRDRGTWREPVERRDRGRGLLLMRSFMDSVEVVPGAPGTEVRMRRGIAGPTLPGDRR